MIARLNSFFIQGSDVPDHPLGRDFVQRLTSGVEVAVFLQPTDFLTAFQDARHDGARNEGVEMQVGHVAAERPNAQKNTLWRKAGLKRGDLNELPQLALLDAGRGLKRGFCPGVEGDGVELRHGRAFLLLAAALLAFPIAATVAHWIGFGR